MLSGFIHRHSAKNIRQPEEIDIHIKENLLSYLQGKITEGHLLRILKQQIEGNSTKLSFKIVQLLPQFNRLIDLLEKECSSEHPKTIIMSYILKRLTDKLYNELNS